MCTCDKMSLRCVKQYSLLHVSKRGRLITFPVCEDNGGLCNSDLARRAGQVNQKFYKKSDFS